MRLWTWLLESLLGPGRGRAVSELSRRLDIPEQELNDFEPNYREFTVPKRSGGVRRIQAPDEKLKRLQRRILHRLLGRLHCHPAAQGFERGRSIVANARPHVDQAVVVHMDLKDFFRSTTSKRVAAYFRDIGWNRAATRLLVKLCTHRGALPQGAPTSPRLSNLVNYRLDARLAGLAAEPGRKVFRNLRTGERLPQAEKVDVGGVYTRYADDLTFSFSLDHPAVIRGLIHFVRQIVREVGYELHMRKKLYIRRKHQCQKVTGLVVNERVRLPRATRRWLRAVEHHIESNRPIDLTAQQLAGWKSLCHMIDAQSSPAAENS